MFDSKRKMEKEMEKRIEEGRKQRELLEKMGLGDLKEEDANLVKNMRVLNGCSLGNQFGFILQGKSDTAAILQMMDAIYNQNMMLIRLLARIESKMEKGE